MSKTQDRSEHKVGARDEDLKQDFERSPFASNKNPSLTLTELFQVKNVTV